MHIKIILKEIFCFLRCINLAQKVMPFLNENLLEAIVGNIEEELKTSFATFNARGNMAQTKKESLFWDFEKKIRSDIETRN